MSSRLIVPECQNKYKNIYFNYCKAIKASTCDEQLILLIKRFKSDFAITSNNLNAHNLKLWISYYNKYK